MSEEVVPRTCCGRHQLNRYRDCYSKQAKDRLVLNLDFDQPEQYVGCLFRLWVKAELVVEE